jgi:hypothetical protein
MKEGNIDFSDVPKFSDEQAKYKIPTSKFLKMSSKIKIQAEKQNRKIFLKNKTFSKNIYKI